MFGKLGDMMGKLQEMKQKAEEIKIKLDNTILPVEAAGGEIKISISGNRNIRSVEISDSLLSGDKKVLHEKIAAAINKAIEAADKVNGEEMKKAAGGLLPGII